MNLARKLACVVVVFVCAVSLAANWLAPVGYAKQFREAPGAPPRMSIGSAPMKWAAIASRACSTARASRCCSLPLPLWSLRYWPRWWRACGYLGGIWLRLARGSPTCFFLCPGFFC